MINTNQRLAAFLPRLEAAAWIALDTEADSLHAYPEKLCLIQISIEEADELLDPLSGMDLAPLLGVLGQHELILHGADYDLRLLRKSCGFVPAAIFDTMMASRLLGCREFGLNNLLGKYLRVALEKGPQKANWARRPLTPRMETYARNDTHYLKPLADILKAELREKGRLSWHQESCARLIADCAQVRTPDPDLVWRVKGSHRLRPAGLSVLREIWRWRESAAIAANKPPFFVLPPETMVAISTAAAESQPLHDLFPRHLSPHRREGILQAVRLGLEVRDFPGPLRTKSHRQTEAEKRRLHELEKRRDRHAVELGIDPTLIASRATLLALTQDGTQDGTPSETDLMKWQRELLLK